MDVPRAASDPTLSVRNVAKSYGSQVALDGVSLAVAPGEIVGLVGPNGAGKSTLVSIVAGLRPPDRGEVRVAGIDAVAAPTAAQAHIGFAPQETGLYEVLTVRENMSFFADLVGLSRRDRNARIHEVAEALRLTHLLGRTAFALSGGERRRLHTAIAFLHRPALLLLDEPTVGADIETREALLAVVRAAAEDGAAVVYSTHYLPEVEALDASVAMLVAGRVIASGPLAALVAAHGRSGVEVAFEGAVPDASLAAFDDMRVSAHGAVLRVEAADPAGAVATIIGRLGDGATRVRSVNLLRPSLDSAFLALTGRRYDHEVADVVAA